MPVVQNWDFDWIACRDRLSVECQTPDRKVTGSVPDGSGRTCRPFYPGVADVEDPSHSAKSLIETH